MSAAGFTGDKPVARTWDLATRSDIRKKVTVSPENTVGETLELSSYMYDEVYGTLLYSLSWDGVGQIPARAELLVEQYAGDDTWNPIPISLPLQILLYLRT